MDRLGALLPLPLALVAAMVGVGESGNHVAHAASGDVTVHEWGTFTSIAGPDGQAVEWAPFDGPSDLPGFVTILNPSSVKSGPRGFLPPLKSTVRMETPVIYFYAGREQTVSVRVRFPQGLITEWYPQATVQPVPASTPLADMHGGIEWSRVRIVPGARQSFPSEAGPSHYYAARETDASPVEVGSQREKFLFYRGLASFPVPVSARVKPGGAIDVTNAGREAIGLYMLFERRGERLGYRVVRGPSREHAIPAPILDDDLESLGGELEAILAAEGLHRREAAAMVETWRDSWFGEGMRLLYIVPRAAVDAILPLDIEPRPAQVVRVFVGRLDIPAAASTPKS
jgi:hypothetical protein